MRRATVQIGKIVATFDGERFASEDDATAGILNSVLNSYRQGVPIWLGSDYRPDQINNLAQDIAEQCGGRLVKAADPTGIEYPEGTIF